MGQGESSEEGDDQCWRGYMTAKPASGPAGPKTMSTRWEGDVALSHAWPTPCSHSFTFFSVVSAAGHTLLPPPFPVERVRCPVQKWYEASRGHTGPRSPSAGPGTVVGTCSVRQLSLDAMLPSPAHTLQLVFWDFISAQNLGS